MPHITNRGAREYIAARKPFTTGNKTMFGAYDHAGRYVVYSYGRHFPMLVWLPESGQWLVNSSKYSPTTSRHQGIARYSIHGQPQDSRTTRELCSMLGIL